MRNAEDIIRDLAEISTNSIGCAECANQDAATTRELIVAARLERDRMGPKMRSAKDTGSSDDYEAVFQVAVAISRDGRLVSSYRIDGPKHAQIPLLAGVRHIMRQVQGEVRDRLKLNEDELEKFVTPLIDGLVEADFTRSWDKLKHRIPVERDEPTEPDKPRLVLPDDVNP